MAGGAGVGSCLCEAESLQKHCAITTQHGNLPIVVSLLNKTKQDLSLEWDPSAIERTSSRL